MFLQTLERANKHDDLFEIELTNANLLYARVRFPGDSESNFRVRTWSGTMSKDYPGDYSHDGSCANGPVESSHRSAVPQAVDPHLSNHGFNYTRWNAAEVQECSLVPESRLEKLGVCQRWPASNFQSPTLLLLQNI